MQHPPIYFDAEGVERGYYVYTHACKVSGQVFYVGKGKNNRAWSDNRSRAWHEHVAALPEGYQVCLLHNDLTEEESIKFERTEIQAHGGPASSGGSLVNWIDGAYGDGFGLAIRVFVGWDVGDQAGGDQGGDGDERRYWETYWAARKFKELSPAERKACADKFSEMVGFALEPVHEVEEGYVFRTDIFAPMDITSTSCISSEIGRLARQLRNRKMRYFDFCVEVEDQLGQLTYKLEKGQVDPKYLGMIQTVHEALSRWFSLFDTGNQREAHEIAQREWERLVDHDARAKAIEKLIAKRRQEQGL